VDPRAGLDDMEKIKVLPPPLGRPARIQSLYLLSYSGSFTELVDLKISDDGIYIYKIIVFLVIIHRLIFI
jgi:hypothetical protein